MRFVFTPNGWEDYTFWQSTDRATLKRINRLLDDIARDPFDGIGKPEHLAAVARRRVHGSDHPGAARPDLIDETAAWVEQRRPNWAISGTVDETVDEVLDYVEMLAAGVGRRRRRSA